MPVLRRLIAEHQRTGICTIAMTRVSPDETAHYGCADVELTGTPDVVRIRRLVEKPRPGSAPSDIVCIGRYVVTPSLFSVLAELGPGHNGEIQLSEAIDRLAARSQVRGVIFDDVRYDIGSGPGLVRATVELALRRADLGSHVATTIERALARHWARQSSTARTINGAEE